MAAKTVVRKFKLPRDQGSDTFQALKPQETVVIAYTGAAAKNADADPITSPVVRVVATSDCYIKMHDLADGLAAVTDMYLPADTVEYFSMDGKKYISAIRDTADGNLYVTLMI